MLKKKKKKNCLELSGGGVLIYVDVILVYIAIQICLLFILHIIRVIDALIICNNLHKMKKKIVENIFLSPNFYSIVFLVYLSSIEIDIIVLNDQSISNHIYSFELPLFSFNRYDRSSIYEIHFMKFAPCYQAETPKLGSKGDIFLCLQIFVEKV